MNSRISYAAFFFASFLATLLAAASVNYVVDPGNALGKNARSYERGLAQILLSGSNAANIANYDERYLQKFVIEGLQKPKDVVVFGSSRALSVSSRMFPGRSFFNNAVHGGTLHDYMIVYNFYRKRNLNPRAVILCLDPWVVIGKYKGEGYSWLFFWRDYLEMARLTAIVPGLPANYRLMEYKRYRELFKFVYLKLSLAKIFSGKTRGQETAYYATEERDAEVPIKRWDGTLSYNESLRRMTVDEVRVLALEKGKSSVGPECIGEPDDASMSDLEKFAAFLQSEGVKVVFLLLPYHPATYPLMAQSSHCDSVRTTEGYYRSLADKRGIALLGSFDPEKVGCSEGDFHDGMHPKESCVEKMFVGRSLEGVQ